MGIAGKIDWRIYFEVSNSMMNALVSRRKVMIGGLAAGSVMVAGGAFHLGLRTAPGALVLSQSEINVVEQASRV